MYFSLCLQAQHRRPGLPRSAFLITVCRDCVVHFPYAFLAHINEALPGAAGPLPAMVVDGFDAEQIWQEIKLQNDAVLKYAQRTLDKLAWREQAAERENQRASKSSAVNEEQSAEADEEESDNKEG